MTDPYDAGNRDEQPNAPPVEAGGEENEPLPAPTESAPIEKRVTQSHSGTIDSASPPQYTMSTALSNLRKEEKQAPDADSEFGTKMREDPGPDQPSTNSQQMVTQEDQQQADDSKEPEFGETSRNRLDTAEYYKRKDKDSEKANGNGTNNEDQDIEDVHPAAAAALTTTPRNSQSGPMQGPRLENPGGNINGNTVNGKGHQRNRSRMEKVKDKLHIGKKPQG